MFFKPTVCFFEVGVELGFLAVVLSGSDRGLLDLWLGRFSLSCRGFEVDCFGFSQVGSGSGEFSSFGEMLEFQKRAAGDDRHRIVDLLISHVQEKGGT